MDEQGFKTVPSVSHTVQLVGTRGITASRQPGDLAEGNDAFRTIGRKIEVKTYIML